MIIEQELRDQIQSALSGDTSLHDLYRWTMDRSWNMHKDSTLEAQKLAVGVELAFYSTDTDVDRKAELMELLRAEKGTQ